MQFPLRRQEMDFWCWAAVSAATVEFFNPQLRRTQCDIAGQLLQRTCCPSPVRNCNCTASLYTALRMVGHLRASGAGYLTFQDVRDEINKNIPIAARIEWSRGSAHFVVIIDAWVSRTGAEVVTIADPLGWVAEWRYEDFVNAYESVGVWSHTYLLKR